MQSAFIFAFIAGLSAATYTLVMRLAAPAIHPVLGAAIVAGVAFVTNAGIAAVMRLSGSAMPFSERGLWLLVLVGMAAAFIDLFSLLAFSSGLRATSSFIIGGTTAVVILLVGFLILREPVSWVKLLAVGLIIAGTLLLQRESA